MTEEEPAHALRPRRRRGFAVRLGFALAAVLTLLGAPAATAVERRWGQSSESVLTRYPQAVAAPGIDGGVVPHEAAPARSPQAGRPGATAARVGPHPHRRPCSTPRPPRCCAATRPRSSPPSTRCRGSGRRCAAGSSALRAMNGDRLDDGARRRPDRHRRRLAGDGHDRVLLRASAGCRPAPIPVPTRWVETADAAAAGRVRPSAGADSGPRPWEVSELRAAVGSADRRRRPAEVRRPVASPPRRGRAGRRRSPTGTRGGVRTGPVRGVPRRPRRVGQSWYGVKQPAWVAGYAMPITERDTEIVLNAQRVTGTEVVDTLRHEFTHVVTLAGGAAGNYSGQWWLVEGMAEYVRMVNRPLGSTVAARCREAVRPAGQLADGTPGEPPAGAATEDASGRYGVAYLTVRRLAERFGEDKTARVLRRRGPRRKAGRRSAAPDFRCRGRRGGRLLTEYSAALREAQPVSRSAVPWASCCPRAHPSSVGRVVAARRRPSPRSPPPPARDDDPGTIGVGTAGRADVTEVVDAPATVTARAVATLSRARRRHPGHAERRSRARPSRAGQVLAVIDSPAAQQPAGATAEAALDALERRRVGGRGHGDLLGRAGAAPTRPRRRRSRGRAQAAHKSPTRAPRNALLAQVDAAETAVHGGVRGGPRR